uniref:Uncharacterized protein n=1 Tax=Vespula pensylvanica TaxID=30213 RepID=A0A834KEE9_VESPE|nr:hypothetical protein H0235_014940 [Vespula pensylvanica]
MNLLDDVANIHYEELPRNQFDDLPNGDRSECMLTGRANRILTRYFVFPVGYSQDSVRLQALPGTEINGTQGQMLTQKPYDKEYLYGVLFVALRIFDSQHFRERTKVFVALRFAVGGHPEAANFNYESSDAGPLTDYTKKVTRLAGSNGSSYEIR